jgi:hypothetical protein
MGSMVRSIVLGWAAVATLSAQQAQPPGSQIPASSINIDTAGIDNHSLVSIPGGALSVTERVPKSVTRPPVVLIASDDFDRARAIADGLQAAGVASFRPSNQHPVAGFHSTPLPAILPFEAEPIAQLIVTLRNRSDTYPTVTVYAEGDMLERAFIAARAARADGVVYPAALGGVQFAPPEASAENLVPQQIPMQIRGAPEGVNAALMRIKAATQAIYSRSPDVAATVAPVANFAKSVRAFGRRGGPAARPAQARRSPRQLVLTTVGDVRIGIEWGSPQKRGREVWGSLVKWDAVWMPGADEATTLTTNGPITLSVPGMASLKVPAGDHTIYTLPRAGRFELIVSKDTGQFHTVHAPELELGRIVMQRADRAEAMEGLTFAIEPKDSGAELKLIWDQREYSVQVTTNK